METKESVGKEKIFADAVRVFEATPNAAGFVLAKVTKGFASPTLQKIDWCWVQNRLKEKFGVPFCVVVVGYSDGSMDIRIEKEYRGLVNGGTH